jgi:hypothetical protein
VAEKQKSFIGRLQEDGEEFGAGFAFATNKACQTCMLAHGEPPWADSPDKSYCQIYERDAGKSKPVDVEYKGAPCEYYEATV